MSKKKKKKTANKYNAKKVVVDGIKFDSQAESKFYLHLKECKEKGTIKGFELQPPFILQESFKYQGKTILAIKYIADFRVITPEGLSYIVDVKGKETTDFKIKAKMYKKLYPEPLKLVTWSGIDGGWIELEDLKKARKLRKQQKEEEQANNDNV